MPNHISPFQTLAALTYTPTPNAIGTAMITVTVTDDGDPKLTSIARSFTVVVTPVNQQPQFDVIPNQTIVENTPGPLTLNLADISAGPGDQAQTLSFSITSSNTALIPTPTIIFTSPDTTGLLVYNPAANASGQATITVTLTDNGGTTNGGIATITRSFVIVVTPVNQPPTLTAIPSPAAILENTTGAVSVNVNLTGIGPGPGDAGQTLSIVATSSNPSLVPNPTIAYTSPNATATLTYAPSSFASGSAVITVTVFDNGPDDGAAPGRLGRRQPLLADVHRYRHAGQPGAHDR